MLSHFESAKKRLQGGLALRLLDFQGVPRLRSSFLLILKRFSSINLFQYFRSKTLFLPLKVQLCLFFFFGFFECQTNSWKKSFSSNRFLNRLFKPFFFLILSSVSPVLENVARSYLSRIISLCLYLTLSHLPSSLSLAFSSTLTLSHNSLKRWYCFSMS